MLVLARPNNKQAEGGIPSKVAEYLACGVPCVITKTGDLPKYLHDGEDCFLCDPDDENIFFQRMVDCYNSDRTLIGCNAKKVVRQFNYIEQSSLLVDYLENKFMIRLRS